MIEDQATESRRQDREFVDRFVASHKIGIVPHRRWDFRPLREPGQHPLFGTLVSGITDGIETHSITVRGQLVHTSLGQHSLPEKTFKPFMCRARQGVDKKEQAQQKSKRPKVNIEELF